MAAASGVVTRRAGSQAERIAALETEPAERDRLGADRLDPCLGGDLDPALGGGQGDDARCAEQEPADVVARAR